VAEGSDEAGEMFVACAWSGLAFIFEPGSVRTFDPSKMLTPPVRAFTAGEMRADAL
jgi:hypothetical protein